jgi:hypothetical protein
MIDHLVLASADLERTVASIVRDWGIRPTPGGVHVGHGTRNELVGIGGGSYLEIIGPDLDQIGHEGTRPFGVDTATTERLVSWCARPDRGIEAAAVDALRHGHDIGPVTSMSRRRTDDVLLEWRLTFPRQAASGTGHSVLPFVIDWLHSEHPSTTLRQPVELIELQLRTTDPEAARSIVDAIGGDSRITVMPDPEERLVARLDTPAGEVTLSG